jgi:hypothetical protein
MADESIEFGGATVTKSMFDNEQDWQKFVEAAVPGKKIAREAAQQQALKEEQERIKKRDYETVTGIGGESVTRQRIKSVAEQERDRAEDERRQQQIMGTEAPTAAQIKSTVDQTELAKTKAELAALEAEKAAAAAQQPQVGMGQATGQAPAEGELGAPTINIQTGGAVSPAMTRETVINQVMQSPEAKKAVKLYEDATQASIQANTQQIEFDVARANELATMKEAAAKETDMIMADMRARDQKIADEMAVQTAKMKTSAEELANYKFQDFFQGRDGARIMAGISVALGAVGSALTKGPNYAMQIIDSAIQNDLAVQKANYEKLKGTFEADQTLYGQLKQRRLDDLQATQILLKTRYDQAALQMEAAASKVSSEEAKNKAAMLAAQLRQEGAKAMMAATEGLKTTVQTQIKAAPGMAPGDVIDARAKFEDRVKKSPVGEAMGAENALRKFRDIVKAGGAEGAVIDFVAGKGGLGQGSVNEQFVALLNSMGLRDFAPDKIKRWWKGGASELMLKKIDNFLDAASKRATTAAMLHIPAIVEEAQLVGLNPNAYLEQLNRSAIQAAQLQRQGARRLNP